MHLYATYRSSRTARRLGISALATIGTGVAAALLFGAALLAPQKESSQRDVRQAGAAGGGGPTGACCLFGDCASPVLEAECLEQNGQWFEGRDCTEFECPQACCLSTGRCINEFPDTCRARAGSPQGPVLCVDVVCQLPEEACCLPNGVCDFLLGPDCRERGGVPLGPNADCLGDKDNNDVDEACEPNAPCDDCGLFPHWIDQCPTGVDHMSSAALVGIDADLDCLPDRNLVLSGPAWVRRSDPRDDSSFFPGLRFVDDHLDVLDTELLAMQLNGAGGISLTAGAGYGAGGVLQPSLGAIAEQPGDPNFGDSMFLVFFEADLGGVLAYNHIPLEVKAKIDCVPPDTVYLHPTGCIPLFNSPFAGKGEQVANLVAADHSTFPACGDPSTGDCFSPNETPFCDDTECCRSVCSNFPECCQVGWGATCVELALELCPQREACCFPDGNCVNDLPAVCQEQGGRPQGEGSDCGNVQCEVLGACCEGGACVGTISEAECSDAGGSSWHPGENCANFECPSVEHDFFESTTALVQLVGGPFGSAPRIFVLRGPAQVDVFFENAEGSAVDDDGNGRDEVETELVSLNLTDGLLNLSLNPAQPSRGLIEEQVNNTPGVLDVNPFAPGDADSFFDVFFQIDDGSTVIHNPEPLRIRSVIDHKPPSGARYIHVIPPDGSIELFDAAGNATGVFIVRAEHHTGVVEIDEFRFSFGEVSLIHPDGSSELISLTGTARAHVFFEGAIEGDADDDDADGLDEVKTELVQLDLRGNSSLGPVQITLNSARPSPGEIEETANNTPGTLDLPPFTATGSAASFFDLFLQVEAAGLTFFNIDPKRIRTIITHKPPGPTDVYEDPDTIPLYDANGEPTGYLLGPARHQPNPPHACCLPDGSCRLLSGAECRARGGIPNGPNTECAGDANGNRVNDACEPSNSCDGCGPGDHWVDQCPAGVDRIPTSAVAGIDLTGDCVADTDIVLHGQLAVRRDAGAPHRFDTEIISMNLTGPAAALRAGAGGGVGGVLPPSFGGVVEQRDNAALADSFFDIIFEIDADVLPGPLYNQSPLRMESKIDCVPPEAAFINVKECLPLFASPIPAPGSKPIAHLVRARSTTFPTEACCLPDGTCAQLRRRDCRARDGAPLGPETECRGDNDGNGVDDACELRQPCQECGPGDHWVDECPGGVDRMPSSAVAGIDLNDDCIADTEIVLHGPLAVRRAPGSPHEFDTEIISMSLTGAGATLRAGAGGGIGGVLPPSFGGVIEQPDNVALADSFFDIMFEIDATVLPGPLYNHTPLRMQSKIDCAPPEAAFINVNECLPLFSSPVPIPDENPVAHLVRARSTTFPTEACCLENGTCAQLRRADCRARDGAPLGPETECAGDADGDRIDDACELNAPCDECGPGEHWVDDCPGGVDRIPSGALAGIDLDGDCEADTTIPLRGSLTIRRSNGSPHAFETEILAMSLTGSGATLRAGAGGGVGGVLAPSLGRVVEQDGNAAVADSFFDIWVEVSVESLPGPLYNQTPLRMQSKIDCVPPEAAYLNVTQCLPLFASPVPEPGSKPVAHLVRAESTTFPPPCPEFATISKAIPRDGTVDARRPHPFGSPARREGIGSPGGPASKPEPIIVVLNPRVAVPEQCFNLCETAEDPALGPNAIRRVSYLGEGAYQIVLDHAITAGAVTTVQYKGDGSSVAYAAHPSNVNADARADASDLISWVECCLYRRCVPPWGIFSCDIDHSNGIDQRDVLEAVDLLRLRWLGTQRPENDRCPGR